MAAHSKRDDCEVVLKLYTSKRVRRAVGCLNEYGVRPKTIQESVRGHLADDLVDSPLRRIISGGSLVSIRRLFVDEKEKDEGVEGLRKSIANVSDSGQRSVSGFHILRFKSPAAADRARRELNSHDFLVQFAQKPAARIAEAVTSVNCRQWGLAATGLWTANEGNVKQPKDEGISVAVIDSGVAGEVINGELQVHRDLEGVAVPVGVVSQGVRDVDGHGTHILGIIGGKANEELGTVGYCRPKRMLSIRGLVRSASKLSRAECYYESLRRAVDEGLSKSDSTGIVKVINLSLSGAERDAVEEAQIRRAIDNNIAVVAAMGNQDSDEPRFPAALKGVIAVGAVTSANEIWRRRQGVGSNRGSHIQIVAPGKGILSTALDGYLEREGTSMATAYVSGAVALLFAERPNATLDQIQAALRRGATRIGSSASHSKSLGNGLLNIHKSLIELRNITS